MATPGWVGSAVLITIVCAGVASGCASSGATPKPFPTPTPPATARDRTDLPPVTDAQSLIDAALKLRGIPYRNGGSDPSGFDCSGFIQWIFAKSGVRLPREVAGQFRIGRDIDLRHAEPGDLIFFTTTARGASHVGLIIGGDQFVHAPSARGVVRVESYRLSYWADRFVGVRRIVADDGN
jgi:cell wall-associated NlpC family hydrolase